MHKWKNQIFIRFLLASTICLSAVTGFSQHYYKDIIGTKESAQVINTYQQSKVAHVTITSFDEKNVRIEDFGVEQTFSGHSLQTTTRSGLNATSILTSVLDEKGRVIKTIDSNSLVQTTTLYQYNDAGLLTKASSTSSDSARKAVQTEEHLWQYDKTTPIRLLRIKNSKDTSVIDLKKDENGNVVEELETRKGIQSEPVYYYYNEKNELTDIVQYNKKAKRLLPEYMFEYNGNGQIIQKITVPSGSDDYLIWRYQYNTQGLKTKEVIYNKQKQLTGKVEYQYSFGH